ncbi:uncharacterized protein LOC117105045 [Anneissia japonica]|uniref:uncharacterized protein LOC117105045 n=1 Tax=Anneissia japonica TaxID=1529436 RepID=UPI001425983D|nr:uncharacterized protein LOC117105045 [Anneissia japonica]XP_033101939.1 uncharacterized protein LOC117105045 [Anneissia japonica]
MADKKGAALYESRIVKDEDIQTVSSPIKQASRNGSIDKNGNRDTTGNGAKAQETTYSYQLNILNNPFTENLEITGLCTFKLNKKNVSLTTTSGSSKNFMWDYNHIRLYGTKKGSFFMDVGRRSVSGPGSLLLAVSDMKQGQEIVRNMKRQIEKMSLEFFLRGKNISGSDDLSEEEFVGEIVKNKFSKHLGLSGQYTLVVDVTGLTLQDIKTEKLLYWWAYKNLRQYTGKETKFSFEGGRSCMAGEGNIEMKMIAGMHVLSRLNHFSDLVAKKKEILDAEAAKIKGGQINPNPAGYQELMFDGDNMETRNHEYQSLDMLLPHSPAHST